MCQSSSLPSQPSAALTTTTATAGCHRRGRSHRRQALDRVGLGPRGGRAAVSGRVRVLLVLLVEARALAAAANAAAAAANAATATASATTAATGRG